MTSSITSFFSSNEYKATLALAAAPAGEDEDNEEDEEGANARLQAISASAEEEPEEEEEAGEEEEDAPSCGAETSPRLAALSTPAENRRRRSAYDKRKDRRAYIPLVVTVTVGVTVTGSGVGAATSGACECGASGSGSANDRFTWAKLRTSVKMSALEYARKSRAARARERALLCVTVMS